MHRIYLTNAATSCPSIRFMRQGDDLIPTGAKRQIGIVREPACQKFY